MKRLRDRYNHEYWPWYLIYLPVFPLYLFEALRTRRAAFFTNVNPGIDMGGFFGERKSDIYALLPENAFPPTVKVAVGTTAHVALEMAMGKGIRFPLIVKPDVGGRGRGVMRVGDAAALMQVIASAKEDLLVQQLAKGECEFGLMFARDPRSGRTQLLSITGKRFLQVTGNGRDPIPALLARDHRGARQLDRLRSEGALGSDRILEAGEVFRVEPIGNHCRGTTFLDAGHLRTADLERAVDKLIAASAGVYYGRMDVRAESEEALRMGGFEVIELNGVSSEPGHIYDPGYSIWRCWRELIRHVVHMARISRELWEMGVQPVPLRSVLHRCAAHFGWRIPVLFTPSPSTMRARHSPAAALPPHGTRA